jgi:hypothetical protein
MKSFEKWTTEEVEMTFGISFNRNHLLMKEWVDFTETINPEIQKRSEELRLFLQDYADFWNEEDIKIFFVIPIIQLINFYSFEHQYRAFAEAQLEAEVFDKNQNPLTIRGKVELVVAKGKQKPQIPYFFLNEYKPQTKAQADPKGQLLIAMLVAQAKNNGKNLPIYGMYSIGQFWFFIVLIGKEYSVSNAYDATKANDLAQILNKLRFVKNFIERNL